MKKQFIIKSALAIKSVLTPATKSESANLLKFAASDKVCCEDYMLITGRVNANPVFSL